MSSPNCAVVFKAYNWDGFVERQARRMAQAAGALDFYILIDETGGPAGPIPFERVIRFTCDDLEASGLAMRFASGGVLWWNPDYAHYQFLAERPDYDQYLFVEYDCVVQYPLEEFVARAVSKGADLVALPIARTFDMWHWTPYQRNVYSPGQAKLALLNVCFHSARALKLLHQRRMAMKSDPSVREWPSSELFVPSEVSRAGMRWVSLAEFGDVSHYDWFPPTLEDDLQPPDQRAFIHPVLDRSRYIGSMVLNRGSLGRGELGRVLSRFPREEYAKVMWSASLKGAFRRVRHKLIRWRNHAALVARPFKRAGHAATTS